MRPSRINFFVLFFIIVLLEISLISYLILNHRMVWGHDGFEWFANQWFFVNGKVSYNEIPLWTPYMNHGQITSYIYNRLGMFPNILMLFSDWIKNINFLPLFYLGMFFDKIILLTGVWLLAKRYFKSPVTVFFVASTVLASTVTLTQVTHTIILIYCLPLILYFLHRFFDSWDWKWVFLSVFLISVVSINIYYFISVFSLAVVMYFLVVFLLGAGKFFKGFKIQKKDLIWLFGVGVIVLFMIGVFILEHDPLLSIHAPDRQANGHIALNTFLTYGGGVYLFKWWELLLGVSPGADYTIYLGTLTIPLIFVGVVSKDKNKYPFLFCAVFFLLFSLATPVSTMAYYCWPMMKYFRHIGLVIPLIKFYLCFLAGFGFEEIFSSNKEEIQAGRYKGLFCGLLLLLNCLFLGLLISHQHWNNFFLSNLCFETRISFLGDIKHCLFYTACLSLAGAVIFLVRPYINVLKNGSLYLLIVILFQVVSMYGYSFQQNKLRSFALTPNEYALMKFQKIPYVKNRLSGQDTSPRALLIDFLGGTIYDETNNFTFSDVVKTLYRSDLSLQPYDRLYGLFSDRTTSGKYRKLVGSSEDKVQFFSNAYPLNSVIAALQDKNYAGDMLFYYPLAPSGEQKDQLKGLDLSQDQRLKIPYQILFFSPNQIIIDVDHVLQKGTWMEYCDTWHSRWKAQQNGRSQKVYIGNLAYKAIPLEKGRDIVRFYFESKPLIGVYHYFMIGSFVWMVLIIFLIAGCWA